jgi:hypothetical protein
MKGGAKREWPSPVGAPRLDRCAAAKAPWRRRLRPWRLQVGGVKVQNNHSVAKRVIILRRVWEACVRDDGLGEVSAQKMIYLGT